MGAINQAHAPVTDLSPQVIDLANALRNKQWHLSCAESCTGGLLSALCTDQPGSSTWFDRGFVVYTNQAKTDMLGVDPALIVAYGAVSEETALAMAQGALRRSQAQLSVAITGIAGPGGGSPEKPVGTVCFAWATAQNSQSLRALFIAQQFSGPNCGSLQRSWIRQQALAQALEGALKLCQRL